LVNEFRVEFGVREDVGEHEPSVLGESREKVAIELDFDEEE